MAIISFHYFLFVSKYIYYLGTRLSKKKIRYQSTFSRTRSLEFEPLRNDLIDLVWISSQFNRMDATPTSHFLIETRVMAAHSHVPKKLLYATSMTNKIARKRRMALH